MVSILSYHECSVSPSLGLLCLFMTDREQRMLCLCYHYLANFALALAKGMSVVLGLVHPKAVIPSFWCLVSSSPSSGSVFFLCVEA